MNNLFQSLEETHRLDTIIFSFRSVHSKNKPGNFLWYELVPSWSAYLYMHLFAAGSPFLFKLRQLPNVTSFVQHPNSCQQQRWPLQPDHTEGDVRNALHGVWHQEPGSQQEEVQSTSRELWAKADSFSSPPKGGRSRKNKAAERRIICQQRWQTGALFPVLRRATAEVEVKSHL